MQEIEAKKKKGLCTAFRCGKKHLSNDRFCSKHRKRYQKENTPLNYTYNYLKNNAKRRGKEFTLTLEEFDEFCKATNYLTLKGKTASSASIDRMDPSKGYSADNIQILSLSENSKKQNEEDKYEELPF